MILDTNIRAFVDFYLTYTNYLQSKTREPNGRLTAGFLWQPKRFQLLKYLQFIDKPAPDPYSLRKFKRGVDVEAHFVSMCKEMGILTDTQKEFTYRGVYGLGDTVLDSSTFNEASVMSKLDPDIVALMMMKTPQVVQNFLAIKERVKSLPKAVYEVKSVKNSSYKWIVDKGEISWHYKLQAGLYGLADNNEHFGLAFIASDDLREHVAVFKTREMKAEIDRIIDEYEAMVKDWEEHRKVPAWEVHDKWMDKEDYMAYDPFWARCSEAEYVKTAEQLISMGLSNKGAK
ncbi:MAG: hypothetical protein IFNCLDLE_02697 [Ignavibacteriaceae bacterium]|nr:hypothetical protein [Ignavibacteriaceae bacterium]